MPRAALPLGRRGRTALHTCLFRGDSACHHNGVTYSKGLTRGGTGLQMPPRVEARLSAPAPIWAAPGSQRASGPWSMR